MKIAFVKVGTKTLMGETGTFNKEIAENIAKQIIEVFFNTDFFPVLVTSGATAFGAKKISKVIVNEDNETKRQVIEEQTFSLIGQSMLLESWRKAFNSMAKEVGRKLQVAQGLVIHDELQQRKRILQIFHQFQIFQDNDIIPIINENDFISKEEIENQKIVEQRDNDKLTRVFACSLLKYCINRPQDIKVIYLTDVKGYLKEKEVVPLLKGRQINKAVADIQKAKNGNDKTIFFKGGMESKLTQAHFLTEVGIQTAISVGKNKKAILAFVKGNQFVGTICIK